MSISDTLIPSWAVPHEHRDEDAPVPGCTGPFADAKECPVHNPYMSGGPARDKNGDVVAYQPAPSMNSLIDGIGIPEAKPLTLSEWYAWVEEDNLWKARMDAQIQALGEAVAKATPAPAYQHPYRQRRPD